MFTRADLVSIPYKRVTNPIEPHEPAETIEVSIPYKRVTNYLHRHP